MVGSVHSGLTASIPGGSVAGGSGHTPGPWVEIETESSVDHEWSGGGRIGGWQDIGPDEGEAVAVVLFRNSSDHFNADQRGEANACLIAAAPELLAVAKLALKTILDEAEARDFDPPADPVLVAELEAVIAKATSTSTPAEPPHNGYEAEGGVNQASLPPQSEGAR